MFNPQPKPQFHNYPLRTSQLSKLTQQMSQLNHEIYQNNKQIQQIRKKFNNEIYQNAYINRLMQKNRILSLKKQQLDYINKMHQYHQNNQIYEKKINHQMNYNLANQYKLQIQQNKKRKSLQKSLQKQRDKQQLQKNLQYTQLIQNSKRLRNSNRQSLIGSQNKNLQNQIYTSKLSDRQKQKNQYIQQINKYKNVPTDKQVAFNQFNQKNKNHLNNLQKIYRTATQPLNINRINKTNQLQSKRQKQYLINLQKTHQLQTQRIKNNKDQLKTYLQNQIQTSYNNKNQSRQNKLIQDLNRKNNQINNQRYQIQNKNKQKTQQFLYSNQLTKQYNQQIELQKINSYRNKQHNYINQSLDALVSRKQINSPESPKSGIFLGINKQNIIGMKQNIIGNQKNRTHNPITNPIPFSIGMTNPYVLKQYENKRLSSSFRGSNLAQIADQSIRN